MDISELQTVKNNFINELKDAKNGKKTSLAFIVNQLPEKPIVQDGEVFQVLVIGGSICKSAIVKKNGRELEIIKKEERAQPVFADKEQLFEFILDLTEETVRVLAINFAYPLQPVFENGKLDGIFLHATKEHTFEGLIGQKVGFELEQFLASHSKRILLSLANDTICLLLSGLIKYPWQNLTAGIVGTGTNFAFFIAQNQAVNLEAGNFNKFPQSETGKIIDQNSTKVGAQIFEKEIAGAYLFKHFNLILEKEEIDYPKISSTEELNLIASEDIPQVSEKARLLINRSDSLVAALLAGLAEFKNPDSMMVNVVMEGSLFWKGLDYKRSVEDLLKKLIPKFQINMVNVADSDITGGAKLVA